MCVHTEIVANSYMLGDRDFETKLAVWRTGGRLQQSKAVQKYNHAFLFHLATLIAVYF